MRSDKMAAVCPNIENVWDLASVFLFSLWLSNMIFNSSGYTVLKSGWLMNNELENMQVYKIQGSHSSVTEDFNRIQKNFVV